MSGPTREVDAVDSHPFTFSRSVESIERPKGAIACVLSVVDRIEGEAEFLADALSSEGGFAPQRAGGPSGPPASVCSEVFASGRRNPR